MPILKLTPSCKDYLWGGSRLRTDFGIKSDLEPLAEAWVLSCHPDGPSYLPDGTTLAAYIAAHPGCLGTDCDRFEQFPILTKFIDAKQNLSVQVHPSNEYALKKEHQYGKTEMWYVLDCLPGAYLYNIQCNGIGPGYIATPQTAPLREIQPDGSRHPFDQFIVAKTPAERWGEAEDLGGPAVFLASEASDFVNGLILYVDGSILAYISKQPG